VHQFKTNLSPYKGFYTHPNLIAILIISVTFIVISQSLGRRQLAGGMWGFVDLGGSDLGMLGFVDLGGGNIGKAWMCHNFGMIYMDLCCFNRPFDDQVSKSIYLETEAKLFIQEMIRKKELSLALFHLLKKLQHGALAPRMPCILLALSV
jgi:hypothetical protein